MPNTNPNAGHGYTSWLHPTRLSSRLSTPMKVNVGFGAALLILAVVAFTARRVADNLRETLASEEQEHAQQGAAAVLQSHLRTLEAGHRGYVATGDSSFLLEYAAASAQLQRDVSELGEALTPGTESHDRVVELRSSVMERLAYVDSTNALYASGAVAAAVDAVRQGRGSPLRAEVDALVSEIRTEREAALAVREADVERILTRSRRVNRGGLLLSALLVLFATYAINADIRERRRAERELADSEHKLRDFLDSAGDLIASSAPTGEVLYVNRAWLQTLGYRLAEVEGRPMLDFVAPESHEECIQMGRDIMSSHEAREVEFALLRRDGGRVHVRGSTNCRYEDGRPVAIRSILRDVTTQREVDRMKDEFVSVVSHELRTPLTSIRGALGLLSGGLLGPLPDRAQRMLDVAVTNTDRLVRLINDILDVERIQSGKAPMMKRAVGMDDLVQQSLGIVRPLADAASIALDVSVADMTLHADPDRIVQMLTNLLSNAIKFSPPNSTVLLRAARSGDFAEITVSDTGRGIPEDKLELIFDRFQQVDATDAREKGGSGLGLAISRTIVEQHDGRIRAEHAPGGGALFRVFLPALPAPVAPPLTAGDPAGGGSLVLVCDDDDSTREVLGEMLSLRGFRVIGARDGEEAMRLAADHQPDVVLLDLLMPKMDGWRTLAELKAQPSTRDIPVVIVSGAGAVPGDTAVVPKPVDAQALFTEIDRALLGDRDRPVLVVEDDDDLARILVEFFQRAGMRALHARDGNEAIRLSQQHQPALLLLDVMLPDTDGFRVVEWLRMHDRLRGLPIVVYTARDLDREERARLGVEPELLFTKARTRPEHVVAHVAALIGHISRKVE